MNRKTTSTNALHSTLALLLITYTVFFVFVRLGASPEEWLGNAIDGEGAIYEQNAPDRLLAMTEEERRHLEGVLMSEARGEPLEGVMAICQVILDRLSTGIWGSSISEVLSKEFAKPYEYPASEKIKKAVCLVFFEGLRICEGELHYFMNRETASISGRVWQDMNTELVLVIGNHEFRR